MKNIIKQILIFGAIFAFVFSPSQGVSAATDTNNFYFKDFSANYTLSKDENNRSIMKVHEELVAVFPNYDQNRGIERAIPTMFDGHRVFDGKIKVWRNGSEESIADTESGDVVEVFRLGKSDVYVQGEQKYTIEYTLTDVIKDSGDYQELYWDANGTGWTQRFENVSATITLDDSVKNDFSNEIVCFAGGEGSTKNCSSKNIEDNILTFSEQNLSSYQTLTFAVKFKQGSFSPYEKSSFANFLDIGFLASTLAILGFAIYLLYRVVKDGKSEKTNKPIIPQYLPPKNINVLGASKLFFAYQAKMSAIILELAVNGYIEIRENEVKGFLGKKKEYTLKLINSDAKDSLHRAILDSLFKGKSEYIIKNNDTKTGQKLYSDINTYLTNFKKRVFYKSKKKFEKLNAISFALCIGLIIGSMAIGGLMENLGSDLYFLPVVSLIVLLIINIIALSISPLSLKGSEMKEYLLGLKMYMKMAEVDRLKYLQSVEGAERIISNEGGAKVKLYEKLMPYASIFGIEKSWNRVLEVEYGDYTPDWYVGQGAFNAMAFSSTMNNISSTMNSYSSSTGSSGSGFSGGSAGGGGGGGGGGGW